MMKNWRRWIVIALPTLLVIATLWITRPLALTDRQLALLSGLLLTVVSWAGQLVHRSIASVFLIVVFVLFGQSTFLSIVSFAYSPTLLLIVGTGLLSHAIMNGGLIDRQLARLLEHATRRPWLLLAAPYVLGLVLVFVIPQAFARVIILGAVMDRLIRAGNDAQARAKSAIIFNAIVAVTMTYMCFSTGDIVLNQSAVRFASELTRINLDFAQWFILMAVPSLLTALVAFGVTYLVFRRDLGAYTTSMLALKPHDQAPHEAWRNRLSVAIVVLTVLLWMTERLHHLNPGYVTVGAVILLFGLRTLTLKDFKTVNLHFLLFLTAAFSIGKVLGQAGVTKALLGWLESWIPAGTSPFYLLSLAAVTMGLHLCIGSSVASMSVVLPILIPLSLASGVRPEVVTLMVYVMVNIHFLLPFHHATMMLGVGKGHYPDRSMLRFGLAMTPLSYVVLYGFYFTWWRALGWL